MFHIHLQFESVKYRPMCSSTDCNVDIHQKYSRVFKNKNVINCIDHLNLCQIKNGHKIFGMHPIEKWSLCLHDGFDQYYVAETTLYHFPGSDLMASTYRPLENLLWMMPLSTEEIWLSWDSYVARELKTAMWSNHMKRKYLMNLPLFQ